MVRFLWFSGCQIAFVIIPRLDVACGTGCTELPLQEVLAAPSVLHTDSGLFDWLLRLLARIEECAKSQPGMRHIVARVLVEGSMP